MVLRKHPEVAEAAVTGVQGVTAREAVTAWVVLRDGSASTAPDLAAYCAKTLEEEKRPREIFVCEALPRNANGKVIKAKLREAYSAASGLRLRHNAVESAVLPRS